MQQERTGKSRLLKGTGALTRLVKGFLMLLSTLAFFSSTLDAQEAIPAAGGNAWGSGGSVSYSVGQVVYTTCTGTNGSAANGVQQPYEISVGTGFEEATGINLQCSAYPNPATDILMLKMEGGVETDNYPSLRVSLYDLTGKLLEKKEIEGIETPISMRNRAHSTYFLKVTVNNIEVKTFKIIKN
jgi:hypothetical protein